MKILQTLKSLISDQKQLLKKDQPKHIKQVKKKCDSLTKSQNRTLQQLEATKVALIERSNLLQNLQQ